MKKINFENGTLISKAKVEVGGTIYDVEPAQYEGTTPLSAQNLNQIQANVESAILALEKAMQEKIKWKKQTINLGHNETVTIPEIKETQEIYVKASYNADRGNYAIMNILNDGVNGYYNMEAYYWQGAYPISVSINCQKGKISNCSDKSNIVLVACR